MAGILASQITLHILALMGGHHPYISVDKTYLSLQKIEEDCYISIIYFRIINLKFITSLGYQKY